MRDVWVRFVSDKPHPHICKKHDVGGDEFSRGKLVRGGGGVTIVTPRRGDTSLREVSPEGDDLVISYYSNPITM